MPNADQAGSLVSHNAPPMPSTTSVHKGLDREQVVVAALEFIDSEGLAGLSMRRLGTRLGVEAMSLYRHVPGKDELLDAVVEHLVSEMRADELVPDTPDYGWQDFLQRLAHGVRRVALAHPKAFPLIASRPPEAPWLRPPLRSLDWVELFLSGLIAEGFSPEAAALSYRSFTSFLLGNLLLEVAIRGADIGPLDLADDAPSGRDELDEFPTLKRLRPYLSEDQASVEFEEALEELIERIALRRNEIQA